VDRLSFSWSGRRRARVRSEQSELLLSSRLRRNLNFSDHLLTVTFLAEKHQACKKKLFSQNHSIIE